MFKSTELIAVLPTQLCFGLSNFEIPYITKHISYLFFIAN